VNPLSYTKLLGAIAVKTQEHGVKHLKAVKYSISRLCAYHDVGSTGILEGWCAQTSFT